MLFALAIVYGAGVSALVCRCPGLREMPALAKSTLIASLIIVSLAYIAWLIRGLLAVLLVASAFGTIIRLPIGIWKAIAGLQRVDSGLRRFWAVALAIIVQGVLIAMAMSTDNNGAGVWFLLSGLLLMNSYLTVVYARWLSNPLQFIVRMYRGYDQLIREMAGLAETKKESDTHEAREWIIKTHAQVRESLLNAICSRSFLGVAFAISFMLMVGTTVVSFAGVFRCLTLLQQDSFTGLAARDRLGCVRVL